jgi:collagenase-like PrtC family protease
MFVKGEYENMRKLELLAPAKNLACGIAAITHGADAVYIGAEKFGARAAAGNSLDDIKTLCNYAHQFGARVYVTVNTIVYEDEVDATQRLIFKLSELGVDAILIQDMATLRMRKVAVDEIGHAPLLHASTQCDTRTPEKVRWLRDLGFSRAVLARELSLQEIQEIHEAVPDMELEVFVHGALCVSYSGVCYASQYCFDRSANRGECAQFCRMKFDLLDADGKVIEEGRHFLSLKDMCQIDNLESLAAAGAGSFKIEGRLKDVGYVKNVVSAYSQKLDRLIAKQPEKYCRASYGRVEYDFKPSLKKTFNRGFTSYFLNDRQPDIASFDTPKALGEYVGNVKEVRRDSFNVSGTASFSNGDGLCFLNSDHELEGFRVNRAVGNRLFPFKMPVGLKPNTRLYRNNDEAFNKILSGDTAERRLPIQMFFGKTEAGFMLRLTFKANGLKHDIETVSTIPFEHQSAKKPQEDNMRIQLTKLGNTPFVCDHLEVDDQAARMFAPSSLLSELRRKATDALARKIIAEHKQEVQQEQIQANADSLQTKIKAWQPEYQQFSYLYNVSNSVAKDFYSTHGLSYVEPAFEVEHHRKEHILMQCRHCLRYSMGFCVRHGGRKPTWREPLSLRLGDGRRFRLEFKCSECQMNVYSER